MRWRAIRDRYPDYFTIEAGYVPLWVLLGSALGLIGIPNMSSSFEIIWIVLSLLVALMAWRTGAHQVRRGRQADAQVAEINQTLGKLVSVTESSPVNVIRATAAKILDLERQLKDATTSLVDVETVQAGIQGLFWLPLSVGQRADLNTRLLALGSHCVHIQHHENTDCTRLARDLLEVFKSAGWSHPSPLETGSWNTSGIRGLRVSGKYPDPSQTGPKVSRALAVVLRTGGAFGASIPNDNKTDVIVCIGPRMATSDLPPEAIEKLEDK